MWNNLQVNNTKKLNEINNEIIMKAVTASPGLIIDQTVN